MGETQAARVAPAVAAAPACASAGKRKLRKRVVDRRWLFNNLRVGELLLDCRTQDKFQENTVLGAVNVPPAEGCCCAEDLEALGLSRSKRALRDLVLFADDADVANPASWLYELEKLLIEDGRAASVKTLGDGFAAFEARYPFYTTRGIVDDGVLQSGQHTVTYPNEILDDFLYLGNMWQAQSPQVMQHLGITHVVNASQDVGNAFQDAGVQYLEVKLPDRPEADISRFFDAAYDFIAQAKKSTVADGRPCRVLVHCTQGISRSATLVILYIMRAQHWSLAQALNFTRAGRGVVVPNDGFLRALLREERRLFRGKCSVTESELELLAEGNLPSRPATIASAACVPVGLDSCTPRKNLLRVLREKLAKA